MFTLIDNNHLKYLLDLKILKNVFKCFCNILGKNKNFKESDRSSKMFLFKTIKKCKRCCLNLNCAKLFKSSKY